MSKTYRVVCFNEKNRSKQAKQSKNFANRKVRNSNLRFEKGSTHKKLYDSWDIQDYKFVCYTKEQVLEGQDAFFYSKKMHNRDPRVYKEKLYKRDTLRKAS